MKKNLLCAALAFTASLPAAAVYLNPDGTGQALIFPYYTVQSSASNPFNTYLTLVNHTNDAKALRVRFRESRNSREVASFNLFLSSNDAWAGALVPVSDTLTTRVLTTDRSCISPQFTPTIDGGTGLNFQATFYTGAFADGNGEGRERTREGWVEVIEMATLTGTSAAAVRHLAMQGIPANCALVQGSPVLDVAAPSGGLSGTLTLINVASGMDFTVNADALAALGTRPFLRPAVDPYPDLSVGEIDPVSTVINNGILYRSTWNRPIDAVSAALMRSSALSEYVLDPGTRSKTDVVITFPTRNNYVTTSISTAPFTSVGLWSANCASATAQGTVFFGETVDIYAYGRDEASMFWGFSDFNEIPPVPRLCGAASIVSFTNGAANPAGGALGSLSRGFFPSGFFPGGASTAPSALILPGTFQNGWSRFVPSSGAALNSLATSTRVNIATGAVTTGAHVFTGLPMTGFTVRTFENGTLSCGAGSCQGNYGGSFPLKFQRTITPAN
jgi:hypothetical protein